MVGPEYFERRFGDIHHLSPIPYLCGAGELRGSPGAMRVEWEVSVPITGEGLLVLTCDQVIGPTHLTVGPRFTEWCLQGSCNQDGSVVVGEGIIMPRMSFSTDSPQPVYFCHFRSIDIRPHDAPAPDMIRALMRNFDFLGLERTAYGSGWSLDRFQVNVAGRAVHFHLSPYRNAAYALIESERIDRALLSEVRVPLGENDTLEAAFEVLEQVEWMVAFGTLNRTFSPVIHLMRGDQPCGIRMLEVGSDNFLRGGIIDNHVIPAGLKQFIETTFDRFVALDAAFGLRQWVDMALVMCRQRHLEFRLASLLMGFEYLCSNYLRHLGETLDPETNIQQKLNILNRHLRFIPRDMLDDTLRRDIRNPLFHQGVIIGSNRDSLWGWYTEYWNLLLQIAFVILRYTGEYISPMTNAVTVVPRCGAGVAP